LCGEYPCARYEGADEADSFITHKHQLRDMARAQKRGIAAYRGELEEKMELLRFLLEHYNDGRRKSLFCLAVNLLDLPDVRDVTKRIQAQETADMPGKAAEAARLFRERAEQRGMELKLRKKQK